MPEYTFDNGTWPPSPRKASTPAAPKDSLNSNELDQESEQALLLDEAYQLGYHKVKDGCLVPVLQRLNSWHTKEVEKARADELEKAVQQFIFTTNTNPHNFSEYATARLQKLKGDS